MTHFFHFLIILFFVLRYSFSVEGVPELSRVKVPSPPGLQLPWSSSSATKRKLLTTETSEASSSSSSSSSSDAGASASQAWSSTQDANVVPSATLSSSSPLPASPPSLPPSDSFSSSSSSSSSWSEAEIAAMKLERLKPVNLSDVQKLLYMHGADKVVGSSLAQVDFVITLGGDTSKKVRARIAVSYVLLFLCCFSSFFFLYCARLSYHRTLQCCDKHDSC